MARRAEAPRWRRKGGVWTVRFRAGGRRYELSTGVQAAPNAKRPCETATREGERLYALALQGALASRATAPRAVAHGAAAPLAELLAEWLEQLAVRAPTRAQYELDASRWLREWRRLGDVTEGAIAAYARRRLREVTRKRISNELSALRGFSRWLQECGYANITIPRLPASALGVRWPQRRRVAAPELSSDEVEAILAALPERSPSAGFPVRARYVLMWETTLRPTTIDRLSVPEHWAPSSRVLRVTADIDKEGCARDVPLSDRAYAALERVAPERGPIFGRHKAWRYVGEAARKVLPTAKAAIFCAQHLRSAAITRALERSANLPGVMHLAGHRHASTTSRYARPSLRAALDVIAAVSGGSLTADVAKCKR